MLNSPVLGSTLVFDKYQRYHFIRRVVNLVAGKRRLQVLEIGGAGSPLAQMLPAHHVVLSDVVVAGDFPFVKASGLQLPFAESAFDVVISTDVLEHMPHEHRDPFQEESLRVCSELMILGFPPNTDLVVQADKALFEFIKETNGIEYPFLKEHLNFGLPDAQAIKTFLQSKTPEILEFGNANIYTWLLLMLGHFEIEPIPELNEAQRSLHEFFNAYYDDFSHDPPTYRTFFLCFKQPLAPALRNRLKKLQSVKAVSPAQGYSEAVLAMSAIFQNAFQSFREFWEKELRSRNQELVEAEKTIRKQAELGRELERAAETIRTLHEEKKKIATEMQGQLEQAARNLRAVHEEREQAVRKLAGDVQKRNTELEDAAATIRQVHLENEELAVKLANFAVIQQQLQEANQKQQEFLQSYEKQLASQSMKIEDLQRYLNLFLNHPAYRFFRFFKSAFKR